MYYIWKLYFKIIGWKLREPFPANLPKAVLAVGPHTSWQDFIIGVAARSLIRIGPIHFLGKKELFDGPFGWLFRALGGTPVDRFSSKGMVDQVAELFSKDANFKIALAPEGTRKKVDKLRTGFYHIAQKAGVPIVLVGFDFKTKQVCFSQPLYPSNEEKDMKTILLFFASITGKYPEKGLQDLESLERRE
jgi:1-acyl-sn-glycerol-3-phosphate acyltransferase